MSQPLVEVSAVRKEFRERGQTIRAVDDVTIAINRGETVGLVGESGCGKSTLARCIVRLVEPNSGHLRFDGEDYTRASERRMRQLRKDIQIVFQDPSTALNPSWSVRQLITEPLNLHHIVGAQARLREVLDEMALSRSILDRRPSQLSGGQRQRVAIARAIVTRPRFIVLDEPTASVDMSIRLSLLQLLRALQREYGLTYLFISHDLSTVRHLCERILVMYLGKVVEQGLTAAVFERPSHVYTQVLLSAIPVPEPGSRRKRLLAQGEPPSPAAIPAGCPFRTRCESATEECTHPQPFYEVQPGHYAACRLAAPIAGGRTS